MTYEFSEALDEEHEKHYGVMRDAILACMESKVEPILEFDNSKIQGFVSLISDEPIRSDEKRVSFLNVYGCRDEAFSGTILSFSSGLTFTNTSQQTLHQSLIAHIGNLAEVENIYTIRDNDIYKVFTIINENNLETKRKIYKKEEAVLDDFPLLNIDFRVISRENRPLDCIINFDPETLIF